MHFAHWAGSAEDEAVSRRSFKDLTTKRQNAITYIVTSLSTVARISTIEAAQYKAYKEADETFEDVVTPIRWFRGLKLR